MTTIDLADYAEDQITLDLHALIQLIASWDDRTADEVHACLGEVAFVAATRSASSHRALSDLLVLNRCVLRSVGNEVAQHSTGSEVPSGRP